MSSALVLFGQQVKKLRIERRLSQEKLAERCGYHRNQIGRIERGEQPVSFDGVLQLSHGLAVPPSEIWAKLPVQKRLPPKKTQEKDK
ncbi:MAG TPA: helix-turn-helix transcriptional regulator [Candidatus Angelobacter sp.]|nr:helix-turn-helix transcriptional regulator [Candidatus Angelobacter sp.]